jgi:dipeptidyl aminopeptidase/acylaminoacyl peptidase
MSGLYEIRAFEKVFGDNPEVRRQASPLTHIRAGAPPFLILYSQWDYLLLAAQARRVYRELTSAGAPAEIAYIPGEGHISELVRMVNEGDATMERILEFLGRLSGRGANEVKAP